MQKKTKENNETNEQKTFSEKSSLLRMDVQDFLSSYKELDTMSLVKKVKDVLVANNIGEIFIFSYE